MKRLAYGLVALTMTAAALYEDAPPPAHTGGFGEPTCAACHFDAPVNDGAGFVRIEGISESYRPGGEYELRVVVAREGLGRGGFQLSARAPDASQAGRLTVPSARGGTTEMNSVAYAHHLLEGIEPEHADSIDWIVRWTAPNAGVVIFNVAANAADGDASAFGDHIYTTEISISPARSPASPHE